MNKVLNHSFFKDYTTAEWTIIKVCICWCWWPQIASSVINNTSVPYPTALAAYIDLSILLSGYTSVIFSLAGIVLCGFYLLDKWMRPVTFLMFTLSVMVFTLEDSNGILNRNSLYSMIFLVQFIAYMKNGPRLKSDRVQYAIQVIAAGYVLAAISKLSVTGLSWISSAPMASLQVLKNFAYSYFDSGNLSQMNAGVKQAGFILQHKTTAQILFGVSLFLEFFAWLALKDKLSAMVYGLLLTGMHLGILYFMNILIASIFYPMLILMVNPGYWVYLFVEKYIWPLFATRKMT